MTFKGMVARAGYKSNKHFAEEEGFNYDTVKSWSIGRRTPDFEATLKLILIFGIEEVIMWSRLNGKKVPFVWPKNNDEQALR